MSTRPNNIKVAEDADDNLLAELGIGEKIVTPPPPQPQHLAPPPAAVHDIRGMPPKPVKAVLEVKEVKEVKEPIRQQQLPQPKAIDEVKVAYVSLFTETKKADIKSTTPHVAETVPHVPSPPVVARKLDDDAISRAFQEFMISKETRASIAAPVATVQPQVFGAPSATGVSASTPNQSSTVNRPIVAPQIHGVPSNIVPPIILQRSTKVASLKDSGTSWVISFSDGRHDEFIFTKYGGKDAARRALSAAHGV